MRRSVVAFTPHDIESQRRRFPAITWLPDEDAAREAALRNADVWLALWATRRFNSTAGRGCLIIWLASENVASS
jgi:hypothetical protein